MRKSIAAISLLLIGCGGPDLGTPEATARAYAEMRLKELARRAEIEVELGEEGLGMELDKGGIWVGQGTLNQRLDLQRAELEFAKDNLGKIKDDIEFDIVDIQDVDTNNKRVWIHFWQYAVKKGQGREGRKNPKAFYLEYDKLRERLHLTQVSGEWRVQSVARE